MHTTEVQDETKVPVFNSGQGAHFYLCSAAYRRFCLMRKQPGRHAVFGFSKRKQFTCRKRNRKKPRPAVRAKPFANRLGRKFRLERSQNIRA